MGRRGNDVNARFGMRPAVVPDRVMVLDEGQATAASSEQDADLLPLFDRKILDRNAGVADCFTRRGQCQRDRARNMLAILRAQLRLPIEVNDLRGDLHRRFGSVERFNAADAALSGLQPIPERLLSDTDRRDATEPGDNYAA